MIAKEKKQAIIAEYGQNCQMTLDLQKFRSLY